MDWILRYIYINTYVFYPLVLQEFGHLSYNCPHNMLGDREPPPKKKKKKAKDGLGGHGPYVSMMYLSQRFLGTTHRVLAHSL